jgi:hypothetical protein
MHHSDSGCWAARGRAEQGRRTGRASSQGGDSDAWAKRGEEGGGPTYLGVGSAGSRGADVRLLRLGRAR